MSKAYDPPRAVTSLSRAPKEKDEAAGVTIGQIEREVSRLLPDLRAGEELRARALLFAILKQGCGIQKLQWLTRYDREFLLAQVEDLRSRGHLYTGTLSTTFVAGQVPGCEELIERITGQKVISETAAHRAPAGYDYERHIKAAPLLPPAPRAANTDNGKEKPMTTEVNGAGEADTARPGATTCRRSKDCGKPDGHKGRCYGSQPKSRPAPRALAAEETPIAPARGDGYFKIEFEDESLTLNIEGLGRDVFTSTIEMIHTGLTGGANG